jgi:hypothetical protein
MSINTFYNQNFINYQRQETRSYERPAQGTGNSMHNEKSSAIPIDQMQQKFPQVKKGRDQIKMANFVIKLNEIKIKKKMRIELNLAVDTCPIEGSVTEISIEMDLPRQKLSRILTMDKHAILTGGGQEKILKKNELKGIQRFLMKYFPTNYFDLFPTLFDPEILPLELNRIEGVFDKNKQRVTPEVAEVPQSHSPRQAKRYKGATIQTREALDAIAIAEKNLAEALAATPDPTKTEESFASIPLFPLSSIQYQNDQDGCVQTGQYPATQATTMPPKTKIKNTKAKIKNTNIKIENKMRMEFNLAVDECAIEGSVYVREKGTVFVYEISIEMGLRKDKLSRILIMDEDQYTRPGAQVKSLGKDELEGIRRFLMKYFPTNYLDLFPALFDPKILPLELNRVESVFDRNEQHVTPKVAGAHQSHSPRQAKRYKGATIQTPETLDAIAIAEKNLAEALAATPRPTETEESFASIPPFPLSSIQYQNDQGRCVQTDQYFAITTPSLDHPSIQAGTYDAQGSGFFPHLNEFFLERTSQDRPFADQRLSQRVQRLSSTARFPVYLHEAEEPTFDCLSQFFSKEK